MNKICLKIFFTFLFVFSKSFAEDTNEKKDKVWSILICTLQEREELFQRLYNDLSQQIKTNHLEDQVEILFHKDNREISVGQKRNELMNRSNALYVNFVDDDDRVHPNYIAMIYEKLAKQPDCVSLVGEITINGKNPKKFIHSIKYDHYFETNEAYYRPPNHINTMKRSIASQFSYLPISYGEDLNWAMRVAKSGLLKVEEEINVPYYFYDYIEKK